MSTIASERPPADRHTISSAPARVPRIALVLFPARVFLALGWIRAGAEKVIDEQWWSGASVSGFLTDHRDSMLAFLSPIADRLSGQVAVFVALAVLGSELIIGACMLTGRGLRRALWAACALNVAFVAFGAVNPSAFYLVLQMTLLFALGAKRAPRPRWQMATAIACWATIALGLAPFVTTLHPHAVIDDPAIMLATLALLCAAVLTIQTVEAAGLNTEHR